MREFATRRQLLKTTGGAFGFALLSPNMPAQAQQSTHPWPQYQYDAGNTGRTTAVNAPDAEFVERRWTYDAEGAIVGSPVIGHGTVYVGDSAGNVNAVDLDSGELQWSFPMGGTPRVAVKDERVIAVNGGSVRALDPQTGAEEWAQTAIGSNAQPTIRGNLVYIGGVAALNPADGSVVWENQQGDLPPAVTGDKVYIPRRTGEAGGAPPELAALGASHGRVLWTGNIGTADGTHAAAAATDERVYIVGSDNSAVSVNIRVFTPDGEQITRLSDSVDGQSFNYGVALGDGLYYVSVTGYHAAVRAFDTETGTEQWSFVVREGEANNYDGIGAPPIVIGDLIYFVNDNRGTLIYALDAASGERVWSHELDVGVGDEFDGLAAADGALFVGDRDGTLYAIENLSVDTPTSEEETQTETQTETATSTATQTGTEQTSGDATPTTTSTGTGASSQTTSSPATGTSQTNVQRGFFTNSQSESTLAFLDSFILTVGGFVLSVVGIVHQLLRGEQ